MKGIIFILMEQFVAGKIGEEKYDELLRGCRLKTAEPFVGPGTYPDEDFMAIFGRAVEALGASPEEVLRGFGRFSFPKLAERFPGFVTPHRHPKDFLKTIDSVVHTEVRKLYEDARLPRFSYQDPGPNRLVMKYQSDRKLCHFMEGLIEGVAEHFKEPIRYEQTRCKLRGDEACEFDLRFEG